MAENLVDMLQIALNRTFTGDVAKHLREPGTTTRSALDAAVPALLAGLLQQGGTPTGAADLQRRVSDPQIDIGHRDSQHAQRIRRGTCDQSPQGRQLLAAGLAPGRKKVNEDNPAALAGVTLASGPAALSPTIGAIALVAFPAMIVGGMDSPIGAVVGGLIIGLTQALTAGYQEDVAPWLGQNFGAVMPYVVMIVILLVRPYGLFGTREVRGGCWPGRIRTSPAGSTGTSAWRSPDSATRTAGSRRWCSDRSRSPCSARWRRRAASPSTSGLAA